MGCYRPYEIATDRSSGEAAPFGPTKVTLYCSQRRCGKAAPLRVYQVPAPPAPCQGARKSPWASAATRTWNFTLVFSGVAASQIEAHFRDLIRQDELVSWPAT